MSTNENIENQELTKKKFWLKQKSFVTDYDLEEKPAFIWQSMPAQHYEIDVSRPEIGSAIGTGATPGSGNSWWYNFCSGRRSFPVFEGLASIGNGDQGWMTELHTDGHLLGSLWTFPTSNPPQGSETPLVASFHKDAFTDFGVLASNIYGAAGVKEDILITCTLRHANKVGFQLNQHARNLCKVRRESLEWRIRCAPNHKALQNICGLMADELMRVFGVTPRKNS